MANHTQNTPNSPSYNRLLQKEGQNQQKYPLSWLLPIIAILGIIPAVIRTYKYNVSLVQYDYYQGPSQQTDFFLHCKMLCLNLTFVVMLFILIYMFFSVEIKPMWDNTLIPLAVYCGLCFLSALASVDKGESFSGGYDQFESVWILLGYGLIVYYTFSHLNTESAVRRTMHWVTAGVVWMACFGLLQAFKMDPMKNTFFQNIICHDKTLIGQIGVLFDPGRVYLSLYNPNYVGAYMALIVPVLIALLLNAKKTLSKIGYGILILAMFVCLFASQSRAGIITLALSCLVMLLCMRKIFLKNWIIPTAAIVIAAAAFIIVNNMNNGVLIERMKSMFSVTPETHPLESIITDEDVAITYNQNTIHFQTTQDGQGNTEFSVTDDSGAPVPYTIDETTLASVITDQRFPFQFGTLPASDSLKGFFVTIDGKQWNFSNQMIPSDTSYYVKGYGSSFFKMREPEKGPKFLEEHYHFANMRGYIWAKTLPLLKKYIFLGSGPDTFTIAFPNWDLVGQFNSGHEKEVITKPHCMYLQIAVQTGVLSLIAFLTFFGWYIISSFRLYWKHSYEGYLPRLGLAILASILGYLFLGLTNDSCIVTSPIFFALAGAGLGINYRLKQEKNG